MILLVSLAALALKQPFVQLGGKLLAVTLGQAVRTAGLDPAGAQRIHKVSHRQPFANRRFGVALSAWVNGCRAFG
jgi:hypothetical protein